MNAGAIVREFIKSNKHGRTFSNDTFIRITADTARGADVAYISYAKLPPGLSPEGMLEVAPDLVIEVRSPSDRWTDVLAKTLDYLRIGVPAVVILDPKTESATVFRDGDRQKTFEKDQTLTIPDVLPEFAATVSS